MFDVLSDPSRIHPAYGFEAVFIIASLVMIALSIMAVRRRWGRFYFLVPFTLLWVALVSVLGFLDARDVFEIRDAVKRGDVATLEGCLSSFHPGDPVPSKTTVGNERWRLAGVDFDYGAGEVRPGYHRVEAAGGLVHPDSRLRVGYVISRYYGRTEIMRLQVLDRGCPPAPDLETQELH